MPVYLPGLTLGGLGYGGVPFGYSPSALGGPLTLSPTPLYLGGYGGALYGLSSYGSIDFTNPEISAASSLNGFQVEVFFSRAMQDEPALFDPANYTLTSLLGVPLTALFVEGGVPGDFGGWDSVILSHTGSTLGGSYQVTAVGLQDLDGNPLLPSFAYFYAFGDETSVEVSLPAPDKGKRIQVDFRNSFGFPQPLLTEAEYPGVDEIITYEVEGDYPILPVVSEAAQSKILLSRVEVEVNNMTSTTYQLLVGPSLSFDYLGNILPYDSVDFIGIEIGTGFSSASPATGLLLSKEMGDTYGWGFEDTKGRITPTSTFRADFSFNALTTISPPVIDSTLAVLSVCDGTVQVDIYVGDILGVKTLSVVSGSYAASVSFAWDTGPCKVSLVRNQKAGLYSLLANDTPILSFDISLPDGAPTFSPGTQFILGPAHEVSQLKVGEVSLTASSTLFTNAWNFIHGVTTTFVGSSVLTRDRVITKRGPLVRGWGDQTPAQKQDVEIRVNGTPVEVAGVNPYVGEIYPLIPIPLTASGTNSVEVDYIWFSNPAFELSGLNTRGLGLNIWDRSVGHTAGALSPVPSNSTGAMKTNRFPMGIALGPYSRPSPKQIAHRYIGFQKGGYSALLNEPSTLLLNRNPHAISIGKVSAEALEEFGSFNGKTLPADAETPWELIGVDTGGLVGDGTYNIVDSLSGAYGVGKSAYYRRLFDLSLDGVVTEIGRFKLKAWTSDGVFTGVGLGVYSGNHLFFVGAIIVSGVKHVGILLNGEDPQLESSWKIGPAVTATALSQTQLQISAEDIPLGVKPYTRFRIASGDQAGIYTIAKCGVEASNGNIILTLTSALPADIGSYGNAEFEILFEVLWDSLISVRAQVSYLEGNAVAYLGGDLSGTIGEVSALPAYPAQTSLILPAVESGVAFWGSVSRRTLNSSIWDISQYSYLPDRILNTVQGLTVATEMGVLPQNDPNDPWYIRGGYGFAQVQPAGNQTLIKSTSAPLTPGIDLEYAYERVEPYFSNRVTLDLDTTFKVESGRLGAGDVSVILDDGVRAVVFQTLLYVQGTYPISLTAMETGRRLVPDLPQASISGLQSPSDSGWTTSGVSGTPVLVAEGQKLYLEKSSSSEILWTKTIQDPITVSYEGLISEATIQISSGASAGSPGIGLIFGCRVRSGANTRAVQVGFAPGSIVLLDKNLNLVQTTPFSWEDGSSHTYRVLADPSANLVVLSVDDSILSSTLLTSFVTGTEAPQGILRMSGSGAFSGYVYATSCIPLRPVAKPGSVLGRTFGILLREGNVSDINGYRIPRYDTTEAPNSSLLAVPVLMDWRNPLWSRIYLDPTWGVCFYRPDIPPPPWASGSFATQTTNPSEAWVSVEYAELPVNPKSRGTVTFGSPNPQAITQSRWDFLRYKIRGDINGFGIAPQNMVLNRAFTFTSGEFINDDKPEVHTILSRTSTLVKVSDSAMYASRVFVVQVGGSVLPSSGWSFDPGTQVLVLNTPLPETSYPVTVTFAVGAPYTKEYLCTQPLQNSPTILNAGTPPVPKSRILPTTPFVLTGSPINDPTDILDPEETPAPPDFHQFIGFPENPNSLYASTEFCEKEEGEDVHISPMCDGPGPGLGLAEIGISGSFTTDPFTVEGGPGGTWGGQGSVIRGSAGHFNQSSVLIASGGSYTDGTLGPIGMVLYPNARANNWTPLSGSSGSMGMNQDFAMSLLTVTPYSDLWDVSLAFGDNSPPSSADPYTDPNPYGIPGIFGHGAAAYLIEDFSSSPISRLGPWAGLSALSVRSLLGGGLPLSGIEFILEGGAPLPLISIETSGTIEAAN